MAAIEVDGERLMIKEGEMTMFQPYRFRYLDTGMVAVRDPNGVNLYEETWYEDLMESEEEGKSGQSTDR